MRRKRLLLVLGGAIILGFFVYALWPKHHLSQTTIKAQQQASIDKEDENLPSNRIFSLLPYYTPYFELQAQPSGKNSPNILFTYLPPPPGSSLPNSDEQTAISNAESWLAQHNVSLNQYKLIDTSNNQAIN